MRRVGGCLAVLVCFWSADASGQAPSIPGLGSADRIGSAQLRFSDTCPRRDEAEDARQADLDISHEDEDEEESEIDSVVVTGSAGALAPIFAGLAGDLAAGAVSAGAAALEEASKARAVGVSGVTAFEFWRIRLDDGQALLTPNFGPEQEQSCLILTSTLPLSADDMDGDLVVDIEPALYAELALYPMSDGFLVEPVYIAYSEALPGAPERRRLPSELHVEVSLPAAASDAAPTARVFGLARISLPELKPGDVREGPTLGVRGELMPFRPETGAIANARTRLEAGVTERARARDLAAARLRYLAAIGQRFDTDDALWTVEASLYPFTCGATPVIDDLDGDETNVAAGEAAMEVLDDEAVAKRDAWEAAEARRCETARTDLSRREAAARVRDETAHDAALQALRLAETQWILAAVATDGRMGRDLVAGSTTIRARFVLIKNENRFGAAVARALSSRAPAVGTAVTAMVGPDSWTQIDSDMVNAELKVRHAEAALATARAGADQALIRSAEDALTTARLELNVAASAGGRRPPYPGLTAAPSPAA